MTTTPTTARDGLRIGDRIRVIGDSGEHFAAPGSFGQILGNPRPGVLDVEFEPGTRDVDGNPHVHLQQWVPAWDVEPAGPRAVQDPA